MRNLHKLLIILISVAFIGSGVMAQSSSMPAPNFLKEKQHKQKVTPLDSYLSYQAAEFTKNALLYEQSNGDLQNAGIVESKIINNNFNEDQLKQLSLLGVDEKDLLSKEGMANAEKLLATNMVYNSSPKLSTFSSDAIKNTDESVTVTIGNETNVSDTYDTDITPFGTYYQDGQNQILFNATELAIAGLGAGDITEIGWEVVTADPAAMAGFNIEIKHTDATSVTGWETDFTNVYSGDYTAVAGWNMFEFSSPFNYDGTSNLLVKVCFDNDAYTTNSTVYYSFTAETMNGWAFNDGTAGCSDPFEGTITERPNTRITGEENLGAPPGFPFDETPITGSFDVPVDGDLTWTFGNNTETYDLWFGLAGDMQMVVEAGNGTGPGEYNYAGLDYASVYEWQVIAHNANGTTDGAVWNFVTECAVVSAPYMEDFSVWPPVCWDLTGGSYEWIQYPVSPADPECAEASFWGQTAGNNDIMTTGEIAIDGGNYGLEFYWSHLYSTSYPEDALEVSVSDDDGATWTQVWYKIGEELNSDDGAGNTTPGTFVSSDVISLGAFGSPIKVRFEGMSGYGPDLFIDDVAVFEVAYGDCEGTITDLAGSMPIEGAVVTVGTMSATTGSDGTFSITGLLIGDYIATCTAVGFNPASAPVTIQTDQTTTLDFAMTAPTMDIDPLSIDITIDPNSQTTEMIDISNNGDGSLAWNAALEMLTDGKEKGETAYAFDLNNNEVVSFDTDIPGTFTTIGGTTLLPFAGDFDNVNMDFWYAIDYNDGNLYTVEVATGASTLVGPVTGVTSGHNVSGMACDKVTGTMYVSSTDITASDIYTIDLTTGALTLIGTTGIPGLIEIAVDGTGTMYGWDIVNDESFTIDMGTGASTLLGALGVNLNYAQGGNWDPVSDNIYVASYSTAGQLMTLDKTTGALVLVGDFQGGSEVDAMGFPGGGGPVWISIAPKVGTLEAGNSEQMTVSFDATDIPAGTVKTANIHFYSDPDVGMVTVPVTMTVGDQEFGYIEGNVMLTGDLPYNFEDVENVLVEAGAYFTNPDSDGNYMITAYPGTYDVTATLYGYEMQTEPSITVVAGGTVSDVDFVMPTINGMLMGYVTDAETTDPIENATVSVMDTDFEVMTDAEGYYEFFLEAGTYDVMASHPTYLTSTAEVVITTEMDTQQDFELTYSCDYCEASGGDDEYIDGVEFGTIVNLGTGYNSGYENFTDMSTVVIPGLTYTLTWYTGNMYASDDYGAWIDWNQDCEFDPETENVVCGFDMGADVNTFEITVPANATPGNTVMRLRLKWSGSDCGTPCGTTTYGEVEDYGLVVVEPIYGSLEGYVTELGSGNPVEGADISVQGIWQTTTNSSGYYNFAEINTGTWDMTCTAMGYNPDEAPVTILEGQTTGQDFALTAPEIDVDPLSIDVTLEPNEMTDETITISNAGNGPLDWSAQIQFMSDEYKEKGSQAYAFDLGTNSVISFDTDAPGSFTTIGSSSLLPFAGDFSNINPDIFYVIDYNDGNLYTVEVASGASTLVAPVTGLASGHNVSGMACNKGTGVMYVSSTDISVSNIYTIDLTTGALTLIGATGIPGLIEIAVDGTGTMYGWDIVNDESFTIDVTTGASTLLGPLGVDLNYAQGGNWDPESDIVYVASYSSSGQLMTLDISTGALTLVGDFQGGAEVDAMGFMGGTTAPWLTIDINNGTLDAGGNIEMTAHFDATGLLPGVYEAEIHFGSDPDVGSPVVVVTMTVEGLIPAVNLEATYDCTDVELMWEMPTGGDADSWNVWRDGELAGNTDVMSYTDPMMMPEVEYAYSITAVYGGGESQPCPDYLMTVPTPEELAPFDLEALVNSDMVTLIWEVPNACVAPDSYKVYRNGDMVAEDVMDNEYIDGPLVSGVYEYYIVAVYYFGESEASVAAYAVVTVGIEDYDASMLQIFPNPAADLVNVKSPIAIDRIHVLNSNGQLVLDEEVNNMEYQINVSKYEAGIYFIKLETSEGTILRKVAVK